MAEVLLFVQQMVAAIALMTGYLAVMGLLAWFIAVVRRDLKERPKTGR